MKRTLSACASLALTLAALAGCSGGTPEADKTTAESTLPANDPTTEPAPEPEETTPEPEPKTEEPTEESEAGQYDKFGETAEYRDGLKITVSAPEPYEPGEYAIGPVERATNLKFTITAENGSDVEYDPSMFYATAQSGTSEAEQIFDGEVGGTPSTTVLPGRSVSWVIAFSVDDPADIVMSVAADWDHEKLIFTT